MATPFDYPPAALSRRHGPRGYADAASCRPWLRDEFAFRCVYCLKRERWGVAFGEFDVEHLHSPKRSPHLALAYENLLYSCRSCNARKGDSPIADPTLCLTSEGVRIEDDGWLVGRTPEAEEIILVLGLNSPAYVQWRFAWLTVIGLADADLLRYLMSFPDDLPDLSQLKPPGGNTRPEGVAQSWFAKRERGELPETY